MEAWNDETVGHLATWKHNRISFYLEMTILTKLEEDMDDQLKLEKGPGPNHGELAGDI